MAKYLVTGGCGFIGSHLVDALLESGHQVIIIDNLSTGKQHNVPPHATIITSDINDPSVLQETLVDIDGCFHLAAIASVQESIHHWTKTHLANQTGFVKLLDAITALNKPIPVVYASSAAIYGDNPHVPLSEDERPNPMSAYGADKLACEYHAKIASNIHAIPTIGLRLFNVYGSRQDYSSPYSGVISIFVDSIGQGNDITIYGTGEEIRDFVYVKDVVTAFTLSMHSLHQQPELYSSKIYNVATGVETSITTLANTLQRLIGNNVTTHFQPDRPGNIKKSLANITRITKEQGFCPAYSLEDGIAQMLVEQQLPTALRAASS
tara:strand:+ start:195 stop:1160 length:966 start_codon:yes stop_codon:yes gene_type:complete